MSERQPRAPREPAVGPIGTYTEHLPTFIAKHGSRIEDVSLEAALGAAFGRILLRFDTRTILVHPGDSWVVVMERLRGAAHHPTPSEQQHELRGAAAYYVGRGGHLDGCPSKGGSDGVHPCTCGYERLWRALYPGTKK